MPDTSWSGEKPEEIFYHYLVTRDVWQSGVKRWYREYVGHCMDGRMEGFNRQYATAYQDRHMAERAIRTARGFLFSRNATPWRIVKVKVTSRRRIRMGEPQPGMFAEAPDLMSFDDWAKGHGVGKP